MKRAAYRLHSSMLVSFAPNSHAQPRLKHLNAGDLIYFSCEQPREGLVQGITGTGQSVTFFYTDLIHRSQKMNLGDPSD